MTAFVAAEADFDSLGGRRFLGADPAAARVLEEPTDLLEEPADLAQALAVMEAPETLPRLMGREFEPGGISSPREAAAQTPSEASVRAADYARSRPIPSYKKMAGSLGYVPGTFDEALHQQIRELPAGKKLGTFAKLADIGVQFLVKEAKLTLMQTQMNTLNMRREVNMEMSRKVNCAADPTCAVREP